ncbi:hypothetical protein FKP32DRAFT_1606288 [Trametes sanguinea]|nr:hypothetical protein FKP32DRAFT_1606288 [Trametes sanguinea]
MSPKDKCREPMDLNEWLVVGDRGHLKLAIVVEGERLPVREKAKGELTRDNWGFMARTKQSAKRSVGGTAPVGALQAKARTTAVRQSYRVASKKTEKSKYSEDGRALGQSTHDTAFYRCVGDVFEPYFDKPVHLESPHHFAQCPRANTSPVFILQLRLRSLREEGSVANTLYHALQAYFPDNHAGNLRYVDIPFDLNTTADARKHTRTISEVVQALAGSPHARVLLFVYTHSHDTYGTLYFGTNLASQSVRNWFDILIPDTVRAVLRGHDTSCFMLCCGALLKTPEAYADLKEHFVSLAFGRLVAFEASQFQAALTVSFFIGYTQKFIIENIHFSDMQFGDLLAQAIPSP